MLETDSGGKDELTVTNVEAVTILIIYGFPEIMILEELYLNTLKKNQARKRNVRRYYNYVISS